MKPLQMHFLATLSFSALAALTAAGGQEGKPPLAKVTIVGKEIDVAEGKDDKDRRVILELDAKTRVSVGSDADLAAIHKSILEEHTRLLNTFTMQLNLLIQSKDFKKSEELEKTFRAASTELLDHLDWCAAEGSLTQVENELRIDGKLRVFAYNGADKSLAKGKALVEGEATFITPKTDKTTLSPQLAIRNGDKGILVTGKAAEAQAKVTGTIRVWGVLGSGKGGIPVLEAEKIEVVK